MLLGSRSLRPTKNSRYNQSLLKIHGIKIAHKYNNLFEKKIKSSIRGVGRNK